MYRAHLIDLVRKSQPLFRVDVDVNEAEAGMKLLASDCEAPDYSALYGAIDQLPEDQRRVLQYQEFYGLDTNEIADLLRLPAYTVRRLGIRARKNLLLALGGPSPEAPTP